ncbi:MAG: hypothetical protein KGH94_05455 [Candidatus Micrarchaeota archaeon]|nr:hypothetical protein [Candidatus Micrarchaeota archaeon]
MAQTIYSRAIAKEVSLSRREQLLVLEIDHDTIDSASAFVDYISDEYGISKSSVWYNLNCLKEKGIVSFADKQHPGEPLMLSRKGFEQLAALAGRRTAVLEAFSGRTGVGYATEVSQNGMFYRVGVYPGG